MTLSETNAALAGLGILRDLRERNTRSSAHWTFRSDGRVLGYYGAAFLPEAMRKPSPWTNLRVPRNEVREVLASRLLPGTVRFGCRAVGYVEVEDGNGGGRVDVAVETVKAGSGRRNGWGGGAGRPEWTENADGDGDGDGGRGGHGCRIGVPTTEIAARVAARRVRRRSQRGAARAPPRNGPKPQLPRRRPRHRVHHPVASAAGRPRVLHPRRRAREDIHHAVQVRRRRAGTRRGLGTV